MELTCTVNFSLTSPGMLSCLYSSELCRQLEKLRYQASPKQPCAAGLCEACVVSMCIFLTMKVTLDAEQRR